MNLVIALLVVVVATALAIATMLLVRRTAPDGSMSLLRSRREI